MKYRQAHDGDWIQPVRRGYRVRCCDCGLVHVFNYRVRARQIEYQVRRDAKATAGARRRRKIKIVVGQ